MKNYTKTLLFAVIILFNTVIFSACKKDSEDKNNNDINVDINDSSAEVEASNQNAIAENISNQVVAIVEDVLKNDNNTLDNYKNLKQNDDNITITKDGSNITIDFGENYISKGGNIISGKINIVYGGKYKDTNPGFFSYITFDNFSINNNIIKGLKSVEGKGLQNEYLTFEISTVDTIILANNGGTIMWNSDRVRAWIQGMDTPINWMDDVYSITGNASGITKNNNTYMIDIISPVIIKMNCKYITQGTLELKVSNKPKVTINYGDGTCDNKANVSVNNKSIEIVLVY